MAIAPKQIEVEVVVKLTCYYCGKPWEPYVHLCDFLYGDTKVIVERFDERGCAIMAESEVSTLRQEVRELRAELRHLREKIDRLKRNTLPKSRTF